MASVMSSVGPARLLAHIPQQWKTQILDPSSIDQSNDRLSNKVTVDSSDRELDLEQWNSEFGLQSGTTSTS